VKRIIKTNLSLVVLAVVLLANNRPLYAFNQNEKPNILFILVDDLGWTDLGCYGSRFYETPHIDSLAARGMKFTNGYASSPVCSSTRASILTGKYPARTGITNHHKGTLKRPKNKNKLWDADYKERLPFAETTVAEALRQGGYQTFFAGKWHVGQGPLYGLEEYGFNVARGEWNLDKSKDPHLTKQMISETKKFLQNNQAKPFFAYLSFNLVHTPLVIEARLREKYQEKQRTLPKTTYVKEDSFDVPQQHYHAVYAGMIEALDSAVGEVLDELKQLNLDENTVIIFTSDNGGMSTGRNRNPKECPTSNAPLRAGKSFLYEGGIRVPFIVDWPGVTEPGSVCDEPVTSTDIFPSFLEVAGLDLMPEQHMDGVSIVPLLQGKETLNRQAIFFHYPHYCLEGGKPSAAVRLGDYKLIELYEDNRTELYNLKTDIAEQHDLSKSNPQKAQELTTLLHSWQKSVEAMFPIPKSEEDLRTQVLKNSKLMTVTVQVIQYGLLMCFIVNLGMLLIWFACFAVAHDRLYQFHSKLFNLSVEKFDAIHHTGMTFYKWIVFAFVVVPYIVLRII